MNILLLRIGRMGDMVLILPAIREILKRYPQAKLYAITSADGLRLLPLVGIDPQRIFVYRNGVMYRPIDTIRVKRFIAQVAFDHIFCFRSQKRHMAWLPKEAQILTSQPTMLHYATRCLRLISPTIEPQLFQKGQVYLPISEFKQEALATLLATHGITPNTVLIGLHPGYSGLGKWGRKKEAQHRMWPKEYFARLAQRLMVQAKRRHIDLRIVVNTLPKEQKLGEELVRLSAGTIKLLPLPHDFQIYLAYVQRLNLLVVANTGVMHLAAALATPLVALFSDLHPDDCGPYVSKDQAQVIRAEDMETPTLGLAGIPVDTVLRCVTQTLGW